MTRKKKKPPPQQKRHQITDSSGWTHIIRGPTSSMSSPSSLMLLPTEKLETSYTVEQYALNFWSKYSPHWRESSCFESLTRFFEYGFIDSSRVAITKCVCLGLGSLTVGQRSSSYQLAALISMLEILGRNHTITEIIFQDPAFNAKDQEFLSRQGFTVVSDPDAFAMIDDSTFLFSPHLECAFIAKALENAIPALCITNDLDMYVNGHLNQYADKARPGSCQIFQKYMDKTWSKAMPEFDRTTWCHETQIYWLKADENEVEDGTSG